MSDNVLRKKEYRFILVALLLLLGLIIIKELHPYLGGILGALTLYAILRRQMKHLVEKKGVGRGLGATLILMEALFFFLIPLTGIAALIVDRLSGITFDFDSIRATVQELLENIGKLFEFDFFNLDNLMAYLPKLGTNVVQIVASNSYSFLINLFIIIFVLYFMLYSYKEFETMIREVLPFSDKNKKTFICETQSIIKANAIGIPLLALVQGSFAYVGYLLFGVSSPLIYALLTAFATILPIVGAAVIYIPLALVFLFNQQYGAAIGLALYGMLVIGSVDNIARFILQKKLADIHPLITVFGVLIGLPMFGFWGVIFGPLLLSLFMLFFNMYRCDYIPNSVARPDISYETGKIEHDGIKKFRLPFFKRRNASNEEEDNNEQPNDNQNLEK